MPFSASCTPLAPSSRSHGNGSSFTTWRRNSSHWRLKALSKVVLLRHLLPAVEVVQRALDVRIPDRARRRAVGLDPAIAQARDGRALRAIHLQRQQIVAPHAHAPRRIEVRDDAALEFERGVGGIVGGALVRLARLVPALLECASRRGTTPPSLRRTDCRARSASGTACR